MSRGHETRGGPLPASTAAAGVPACRGDDVRAMRRDKFGVSTPRRGLRNDATPTVGGWRRTPCEVPGRNESQLPPMNPRGASRHVRRYFLVHEDAGRFSVINCRRSSGRTKLTTLAKLRRSTGRGEKLRKSASRLEFGTRFQRK